MEKNSMKNELCMRNRTELIIMFIFLLMFSLDTFSQDKLPEKAKRDHNSGPVFTSDAMAKLMKYIPVSNSIPSAFKDTTENVIYDPDRTLDVFWDRISAMDRPVRIVHLGDSHVRGHIFPYVIRKLLEEDFGNDAVIDYDVTYATSGIAQETGKSGIVYHIIGVNGATCESFNKPDRIAEIIRLNPDLIIMSFGTNEAHGRNYKSSEHIKQMYALVNVLKESCCNASFLMTTPPGAYVRSGRRSRVINSRTPLVVKTEENFAIENNIAIWNLFDVVGGKSSACVNWNSAGMFQKDKIHFTREGYTLQGVLFHEAFIKSYNDYVATKFE